jgi:hypothetical protein
MSRLVATLGLAAWLAVTAWLLLAALTPDIDDRVTPQTVAPAVHLEGDL